MKVAIMQPYFMPYIGYFQLINEVDIFVLYDNIEYTKKGWINRNRILVNGKDEYITLSLKKDSDRLHVNQRYLSDNSVEELNKTLNKISEVYRKAPYFNRTIELLNIIFNYHDKNLFNFIKNSLEQTLMFLNIKTPIVISSTLSVNHELKAEEKVIAICNNLKAKTYINPIGGMELYNNCNFLEHSILLKFLLSNNTQYKQFNNEFLPWLSIIDVMMFNSPEQIQNMLRQYSLGIN